MIFLGWLFLFRCILYTTATIIYENVFKKCDIGLFIPLILIMLNTGPALA